MDRLALFGISHRRGGLDALERWQRGHGPQALERLGRLGVLEHALIETCNRWDLLLVLPDGLKAERLRSSLTPAGTEVRPYLYLGEAALEQLARIASSLDSLNPGEDQIMAQVRGAFAAAREAGAAGQVLSFAFHTALRVAKRVRRELALAPANTSLFSLARPALEARLRPGDTAVVLGSGTMGALAAKGLAELPGVRVVVVSRSAERAAVLAAPLGAESLGLEAFVAEPPRAVRALVCALAAPGLVDEELLGKLPRPLLVVDLGMPRNVAAGAAEAAGAILLDVAALRERGAERRRQLAGRLARAEQLVQLEVERAMAEWTERQLAPSIRHLRELYRATLGESVAPEEAERLAHKFAHVPVKGLRAIARAYGLEAARLFLAETGLAE